VHSDERDCRYLGGDCVCSGVTRAMSVTSSRSGADAVALPTPMDCNRLSAGPVDT
jgi:hypothetical protein